MDSGNHPSLSIHKLVNKLYSHRVLISSSVIVLGANLNFTEKERDRKINFKIRQRRIDKVLNQRRSHMYSRAIEWLTDLEDAARGYPEWDIQKHF